MQEWLTVIIILLIVAVVLDGLRRMRHSRRSALRMSRNVNQQSTAAVDDINDYGSELPSGGARVVNVRKAKDAVERNVEIKQQAAYKRRNQLKSFRIPEQVSLNLDQQVPTLMESVAHEEPREKIKADPFSQDDIADFNDDDRIEPVFASNETEEREEELDEWDRASFSDGNDEIVTAARVKPREQEPTPTIPASAKQTAVDTAADKKPEPEKQKSRYQDEEVDDFREPELVLVINVMAPKGEQFGGSDLLEIILNQGLRFGAMNIFHRHEEESGDGEILYSMANIVVPGTFELAKMKTFSTPGVSFFLTLPMDANCIDAFEDMLTTAKIIAARLDGELKDENRSVLTPQIITHYRSKLQEFARKQLSKAPA